MKKDRQMLGIVLCIATIGYDDSRDLVIDDTCHRVEINTVYKWRHPSKLTFHGKTFTQYIFWDLDDNGKWECRDWRLVESEVISYRTKRNKWVLTWTDRGVIRRVIAHTIHRTRTSYDPEVKNRKYLPKNERRRLRVQINKRSHQ